MLFQFGVVQSVNFDAFRNAVSVRAVHQFQPIIQQIVTAQKFAAHPDWPTGRCHINRKIFLDFIYDFKCIAAFAVHFVTKGQNWQIAQAADLEQFAGLTFDALCAVNHHHSRIHSRQCAIGVFGKIAVAWGIHKVETEIMIFKGHGRCAYRNSAVLFHLHEI